MSDQTEDVQLLIAAVKSFDAKVNWESAVPKLGISGTSAVPANYLA